MDNYFSRINNIFRENSEKKTRVEDFKLRLLCSLKGENTYYSEHQFSEALPALSQDPEIYAAIKNAYIKGLSTRIDKLTHHEINKDSEDNDEEHRNKVADSFGLCYEAWKIFSPLDFFRCSKNKKMRTHEDQEKAFLEQFEGEADFTRLTKTAVLLSLRSISELVRTNIPPEMILFDLVPRFVPEEIRFSQEIQEAAKDAIAWSLDRNQSILALDLQKYFKVPKELLHDKNLQRALREYIREKEMFFKKLELDQIESIRVNHDEVSILKEKISVLKDWLSDK